MTQEFYTISDAAKMVQVEAHVLRYWEEELKLPITRNEMGYRAYSREDIEQLKRIKKWKEQGLQLKAIRLMLSEDGIKLSVPQEVIKEALALKENREEKAKNIAGRETADETCILSQKHRKDFAGAGENNRAKDEKSETEEEVKQGQERGGEHDKGEKDTYSLSRVEETGMQEKNYRLQLMLHNLVSEAVRENNRELKEDIREVVLKELDFQFRQQEELAEEREERRLQKEEEHYRKLDELLRQKRNVEGRRERKEREAREKRERQEKEEAQRRERAEKIKQEKKEKAEQEKKEREEKAAREKRERQEKAERERIEKMEREEQEKRRKQEKAEMKEKERASRMGGFLFGKRKASRMEETKNMQTEQAQ